MLLRYFLKSEKIMLLNVVKGMMMKFPEAANFITDVFDVTLGVLFFDCVTLFKETAEKTSFIVQYFGQWY